MLSESTFPTTKTFLHRRIQFWEIASAKENLEQFLFCLPRTLYGLISSLIVKMNSSNNVRFHMETHTKRNPTRKNNTIMKCKEKRGINMSDFILCDKAMRMSWVKVLYRDWRVAPENDAQIIVLVQFQSWTTENNGLKYKNKDAIRQFLVWIQTIQVCSRRVLINKLTWTSIVNQFTHRVQQ